MIKMVDRELNRLAVSSILATFGRHRNWHLFLGVLNIDAAISATFGRMGEILYGPPDANDTCDMVPSMIWRRVHKTVLMAWTPRRNRQGRRPETSGWNVQNDSALTLRIQDSVRSDNGVEDIALSAGPVIKHTL